MTHATERERERETEPHAKDECKRLITYQPQLVHRSRRIFLQCSSFLGPFEPILT